LGEKAFWAGGMAKEVECLPSKGEVLSTNHITAKKKEKEKKLYSFSPFSMVFSCRFFVDILYQVEEVPLYF
jgi:hypothetical protein